MQGEYARTPWTVCRSQPFWLLLVKGTAGRSAATTTAEAFVELHGVREIEAFIVTSTGRKALRTWQHLESSLLAIFLGRYLELPMYNKKRGSIRYAEDVTLFKRKALEKILLRFVK